MGGRREVRPPPYALPGRRAPPQTRAQRINLKTKSLIAGAAAGTPGVTLYESCTLLPGAAGVPRLFLVEGRQGLGPVPGREVGRLLHAHARLLKIGLVLLLLLLLL